MATVSEPTMDQWETLSYKERVSRWETVSYEDRVTHLRKHGQSGGLDLTMDQWKTSIGQILGGNSEYKDHVIHIRKQGQSGGLELIRVENRNPVLIWTAQGELIRTHGEFRFVKDHILRQMLLQMGVVKTITITLDREQARTALQALEDVNYRHNLPPSLDLIVEKLDQALMLDGSGDEPEETPEV